MWLKKITFSAKSRQRKQNNEQKKKPQRNILMLHNMATYQSEPLTLVFTDIAALHRVTVHKSRSQNSQQLNYSII